ncbi:hypothetical protein H1R20_g2450, partial [Candolleomyces eurysporus]
MASPINGRKPAGAVAREKGSFISLASQKPALIVKTPPTHPSSSFFSSVLTLGHAHWREGRTKVFDADFYIGANNCHAMSSVLFFYDRDNKYNQLGFHDITQQLESTSSTLWDVSKEISMLLAILKGCMIMEFIGVRDPEDDYCGSPLDFTFRHPVKFSITGAAWQCDAIQNTFFIDAEPYISSFAKGHGFGKSDKKPMPRDNKVVTIEGCITDVTWGEDIDLPIQCFHVDVVSIAFVRDVGKSSDSTLIPNTLDPSTSTPARGAGRFQSAFKKSPAVASSSGSWPSTPAATTPAITTNLSQTPSVPLGHSTFNPKIFVKWETIELELSLVAN